MGQFQDSEDASRHRGLSSNGTGLLGKDTLAKNPRKQTARNPVIYRGFRVSLGHKLKFLCLCDSRRSADVWRGAVSTRGICGVEITAAAARVISRNCATFWRMSETKPNPPPPIRTFTTTAPIKACRLRRDDLARLYRIINDRQIEYGQMFITQVLAQQPTESPEQFQERQARVLNAFVTTVSVTGSNTQIVIGSGENFLASQNIPDNILTVLYSTITGPNAVNITRELLQNKATLILDFSRPTILDFTKLPTFATPNNSNFEIVASSEAWFTTLNTRLTQLFDERRTPFNWLHQPGIYDLLLFIVGLPFALWIDYRFSPSIDTLKLPRMRRWLSNNRPSLVKVAPCRARWCVLGSNRGHSKLARNRQARRSRIRCYRIQCTRMEPRKPTGRPLSQKLSPGF